MPPPPSPAPALATAPANVQDVRGADAPRLEPARSASPGLPGARPSAGDGTAGSSALIPAVAGGIAASGAARESHRGEATAAPSHAGAARALQRYIDRVFRPRIAARFRYPEEAEELGLEGIVVVHVSLLASGALARAPAPLDCRERLLCEAAVRTVREAAPFPPPPPELGAVTLDVPLEYRLE